MDKKQLIDLLWRAEGGIRYGDPMFSGNDERYRLSDELAQAALELQREVEAEEEG